MIKNSPKHISTLNRHSVYDVWLLYTLIGLKKSLESQRSNWAKLCGPLMSTGLELFKQVVNSLIRDDLIIGTWLMYMYRTT